MGNCIDLHRENLLLLASQILIKSQRSIIALVQYFFLQYSSKPLIIEKFSRPALKLWPLVTHMSYADTRVIVERMQRDFRMSTRSNRSRWTQLTWVFFTRLGKQCVCVCVCVHLCECTTSSSHYLTHSCSFRQHFTPFPFHSLRASPSLLFAYSPSLHLTLSHSLSPPSLGVPFTTRTNTVVNKRKIKQPTLVFL